jgi:hypothetical protein
MEQFSQGFTHVTNPYNKKRYLVNLSPEKVAAVVLWSKNFQPLLKELPKMDSYQFFFMFTMNDSPLLEPKVISLEKKFEQLAYLVKKYGRQRIFLRFDPIVFWLEGNEERNNLDSFERILHEIARYHFPCIITSFVDLSYRKLAKRKIIFSEISLARKNEIAFFLAQRAAQYDILLKFCCNDYLQLNKIPNASKAACLDGEWISQITGQSIKIKKDPSQRSTCFCNISKDIGGYQQQCFHNCIYCYANPNI